MLSTIRQNINYPFLMRYKMRYFSYLVIAVMIFGAALTSCKENDDNPREFNVPLLDSIFVSEHNALSDNIFQIEHGYEYGCQNRITKRGTVRYGYSDYVLYYNASGDTIKYTSCYISSRCYRFTFSKSGKKVNVFIRYHPTVSLFGSINGELELNAQGLPVKLTYEEVGEYSTNGSNYRNITVVTLTWQNRNLAKMDWETGWETENVSLNWKTGEIDHVESEEGASAGTVTYTHDDKKTPFYHCDTPKWALWLLDYFKQDVNYGYNMNNIKTVTREDGNSITYEYTYNDDGFPVTRTWDEEAIIYTEKYIYKVMGSTSNDVCTLEGYW